MRIIVTGALGYIGSALLQDLPKSFPDSQIIGLDNLGDGARHFRDLLADTNRSQFLPEDIRTFDFDSFLKNGDLLVHLAALTDTVASFEHADLYREINTEATARIAKTCSKKQIPLLFISTTNVYGKWNGALDEKAERDTLRPENPYATSKLEAEKIIEQTAKKNPFRFTILRFGTVFGTAPRMHFHTAVNKFAWQASRGQPLTVWQTAMDQSRPYLYLGDALFAITSILRNKRWHQETLHFASINATVREILTVIGRHIPDLSVTLTDSPTMNAASYGVRLEDSPFPVQGTLEQGINEILNTLATLTPKTPCL